MTHSLLPSGWTEQDLDELSAMCIALAEERYCASCKVRLGTQGEKHCSDCTVDIVEWLYAVEVDKLAQEVQEKIAVDRGLY